MKAKHRQLAKVGGIILEMLGHQLALSVAKRFRFHRSTREKLCDFSGGLRNHRIRDLEINR